MGVGIILSMFKGDHSKSFLSTKRLCEGDVGRCNVFFFWFGPVNGACDWACAGVFMGAASRARGGACAGMGLGTT